MAVKPMGIVWDNPQVVDFVWPHGTMRIARTANWNDSKRHQAGDVSVALSDSWSLLHNIGK